MIVRPNSRLLVRPTSALLLLICVLVAGPACARLLAGQPPTPAAPAPATPAPTTQGGVAQSTPAATAPDPSRPRVRLVATGGTISNRPGGRLTAEELVKMVPQLDRYARVESEQFSNLASAQLSLEQWVQLAMRINTLLSTDTDLAGIVVTSGTDTLEELAWFLHLTVRSERPVVVVGSMRRPEAVGYEGAANLLAAFRVGADPQSRNRGALVVLNDEIQSAREVTKTNAQRLDTFQTRGYGLLGVVDTDRVVYYRSPERRHSVRSEFDLAGVSALPRVDVLLTYQGASGDLIRAAVDAGARGIVLATAAGAMSGTQSDGVRYAADRKVAVVRTTRTGGGRIMGGAGANARPAEGGDPSNGEARPPGSSSIAGEDLAPIKARILLMLALTRTSDPREIQRIFLEY
jgi:L-asparaginase